MSKPFPDLKTDEEAERWLAAANLADYDLAAMQKIRFELAPKDSSISLRLPAALLEALRARAAQAKMPTQRLIRVVIEAGLGDEKGKGKPSRPARRASP